MLCVITAISSWSEAPLSRNYTSSPRFTSYLAIKWGRFMLRAFRLFNPCNHYSVSALETLDLNLKSNGRESIAFKCTYHMPVFIHSRFDCIGGWCIHNCLGKALQSLTILWAKKCFHILPVCTDIANSCATWTEEQFALLLWAYYNCDSSAIRARYNILRGIMCFRAIMNMSILLRCCRML